jgi:hypothetical protein
MSCRAGELEKALSEAQREAERCEQDSVSDVG